MSRKSKCKLESRVNSFLLRRGKVAAPLVLLFLIKTAGARLNFLCVRGAEFPRVMKSSWENKDGRRYENNRRIRKGDNELIMLKEALLLSWPLIVHDSAINAFS